MGHFYFRIRKLLNVEPEPETRNDDIAAGGGNILESAPKIYIYQNNVKRDIKDKSLKFGGH